MTKRQLPPGALALVFAAAFASTTAARAVEHTFAIGEEDLLLDGKPFQVRCGEIHFARIPREDWRQRLKLCRAMGLNTVCAYLFLNFHEFEQGHFDWQGQADAAEFCRLAQEEGLWVILRPGPYACAEWDGGGLPWWLLKKPDIAMRSRDPDFMAAAVKWLAEVGRVMGPLQVTKGGPILMAQVENEYGSYGQDADYMGGLRKALLDAGFDIPLFACNPGGDLRRGLRSDLFQVVNFGSDPAGSFAKLREVQPKGPLMCGEFYPGWFDTWGAPHHLGNTDAYLADLETMLKMRASFSIYMADGGTSFGLWAGADRPFKPDTSSYDYDAPIGESGRTGEKYARTRTLMAKYLLPGETLPEAPAAKSAMAIPAFELKERAGLFDNLPEAISTGSPMSMEACGQGHGCMLYRVSLPAGPAGTLQVAGVHDFAWAFFDGKPAGVMDRRSRRFSIPVPERKQAVTLDLLVEAMGHVNFGAEIHDRKGLEGPVKLVTAGGEQSLDGAWKQYPLKLDAAELSDLKWGPAGKDGPAFWRGQFQVAKSADTFLDLHAWNKGVVWVNGHCLSRFWVIGPQQTAYLPGAWLHEGTNEIIVLDLIGPQRPVIAGLEKPVLNELHPELDFGRAKSAKHGRLELAQGLPVCVGVFKPGGDVQEVKFPLTVVGSQFVLEAISSLDGQPYAAVSELDLLDEKGHSIPHASWTIGYADSEELDAEDGSASNAIDGQSANFWHTQWKNAQPGYPHQLLIDLGAETRISGFRYTPRAGNPAGRIKEYRAHVGNELLTPE